ncbi:ComEC/Rec2 family competence protein [Vibrio algarum]|uniref:MBL fold metallo-hydrolase n=1 Tax=Vibrio algarum TaxID=3020714 RepID=A0ABT4YPB8_9VIBR|nr:hypothetical protein [Vibrio sp. KJ40-1]MDB1123401.1 hypothetical protein [Vibrio sp. KJ40-1]
MLHSFKIHLLEAKTGDSFIVECGNIGIIVDGGTRSVAKILKRYLKSANFVQLRAIFVSHVDRDHVGGIVKLFSHFSQYVPKSVQIYMNHPELAHAISDESGLVTYEDGNDLKSILDAYDYNLEQVVSGQKIDICDVGVKILSPEKLLLTSLYQKWEKHDEGLVCSDPIDVDCSVIPKEPITSLKDDIVNASSLSFILSYMNESILFLSDSLPETINARLEKKQKFNIVKVSHHGSKNNTSMELLKKVVCNKFIISTNGPRSYGHPHAETIVRLIHSCIYHGFSDCNIYFNYEKVKDRIVLRNVPKCVNVNLIYSKSINV